jgi:hypothetical protein
VKAQVFGRPRRFGRPDAAVAGKQDNAVSHEGNCNVF